MNPRRWPPNIVANFGVRVKKLECPMSTDQKGNAQDPVLQEKLALITSRQAIIIALITAVSGTVGAAINAYLSKPSSNSTVAAADSSKTDNASASTTPSSTSSSPTPTTPAADDKSKSADAKGADGAKSAGGGREVSQVERETFYRIVEHYLEEDLAATSNKLTNLPNGVSADEVNYNRVRRAVFLNMGNLGANKKIAEQTLDLLSKSGFEFVPKTKARLVSEFSQLRGMKLRWLKDVVTPAIAAEVAKLSKSPAQYDLSVSVPLPVELTVVPGSTEQATKTFTSQAQVDAEVDSIEHVLDEKE